MLAKSIISRKVTRWACSHNRCRISCHTGIPMMIIQLLLLAKIFLLSENVEAYRKAMKRRISHVEVDEEHCPFSLTEIHELYSQYLSRAYSTGLPNEWPAVFHRFFYVFRCGTNSSRTPSGSIVGIVFPIVKVQPCPDAKPPFYGQWTGSPSEKLFGDALQS